MRIRAVTSPYQITTVYGKVPGYPLNNGFHTGVDYVTGDKKILAPQDAKVTAKGYEAEKNGNYIVLEANGYRDWFSHLSSYAVGLGDTVKQGQLVGYMGKTGAATGTHLHHSLRVNGVMVDPEQHITKEEEEMYPTEGALQLFTAQTGWQKGGDGRTHPNAIAKWTTGTDNDDWEDPNVVLAKLLMEAYYAGRDEGKTMSPAPEFEQLPYPVFKKK